MNGMINCRICGIAKPHSHQDYEILVETVIRPAFELWLSQQFVHRIEPVKSQLRSGFYWDHRPAESGAYPCYFGWNGTPRHSLGTETSILEYWAYRNSYLALYRNDTVELFWQIFLAAWYQMSAIKKSTEKS